MGENNKKPKIKGEGNYRDYDIVYREWNNSWEAMKDGESVYNNTVVEKVKKYVDKLYTTSFKRIKALCNERYSGGYEYEEVTITSVDDEGRVWVTNAHGERMKLSKDKVKAYNDKNVAIVKKIEESRQLEEKQRQITRALQVSLKPAIKES